MKEGGWFVDEEEITVREILANKLENRRYKNIECDAHIDTHMLNFLKKMNPLNTTISPLFKYQNRPIKINIF